MFSYINEEIHEEAYLRIRRPSKIAPLRDRRLVTTPEQLVKWKKMLSQKQIRSILKIVHWFGLDFYAEEPKPDYNALKTGNLHSSTKVYNSTIQGDTIPCLNRLVYYREQPLFIARI